MISVFFLGENFDPSNIDQITGKTLKLQNSEEMYFHHTEAIAGIRDARFQTMMPDALILGDTQKT